METTAEFRTKIKKDNKGLYVIMPKLLIEKHKLKVGDNITVIFTFIRESKKEETK